MTALTACELERDQSSDCWRTPANSKALGIATVLSEVSMNKHVATLEQPPYPEAGYSVETAAYCLLRAVLTLRAVPSYGANATIRRSYQDIYERAVDDMRKVLGNG